MKTQEKLLNIIKTKENNQYYKANSQMFDKLIDIILNSKSIITVKNKILQNDQLKSWIDEQLPQLNGYTLYTKLHWILFDRHEFPICQYCHQKLKNINIATFGSYNTWCCAAHRNKDPKFLKECGDALERKYGSGIRCTLNVPSIRQKIKETWNKKYGTDNPFALPKIKEKRKQTFIEKYGVENNMKCTKGMQEYKASMQKKYGVDYSWQLSNTIEKSKQTSFERYGVNIASQSQQVKDKQAITNLKKYGCKSALQNRQCHEKSIQTNLKKYGVLWPMQTKEIQDKTRAKYHYDNQTFDSSWELAFWIYCKDNNISIKRAQISFDYVDEKNISHKYFPDFDVDGQLIEIKGDDQFDKNGKMIDKLNHARDYIAAAKHKCMLENNIKILKGKEIKKYLDYVHQKYGRNFIKMFKTNKKTNDSII